MRRDALAPAKVNLFLHVGPVDADGYHPLASLVAFADLGDRLSAAPADSLSLAVTGPFATGLAGEGDNLVLRALKALGQVAGTGSPGLWITLDKQLPIAAGLGGADHVQRDAVLGAAARVQVLDLEQDLAFHLGIEVLWQAHERRMADCV